MKVEILKFRGLTFEVVTDAWLSFKNVGAEKERCLVSIAGRVRFSLVINMPRSRKGEKGKEILIKKSVQVQQLGRYRIIKVLSSSSHGHGTSVVSTSSWLELGTYSICKTKPNWKLKMNINIIVPMSLGLVEGGT